jgi:hypothetical protein
MYDPTVYYTPTDPYFVGVDEFTYTVSDGNGGFDTATVTVTVGPGQWATRVIDVSSVWTSSGPFDWNAEHILGLPNTWEYGDIVTAWAPDFINPDEHNDAVESITLGFDEEAPAYGFLIRETYGNGFVTEVEFQDASDDSWESVWSGSDPSLPGSPANFYQTFSPTSYDVKAMRITINTSYDTGAWEEIDAVKLFTVGTDPQPNEAPSADSASKTLNEDASVDITFAELASDDDVTNGRDWIFFRVGAQPEHGYVELTGDRFTYYPDPDYNGSDSFEFKVIDIFGESATNTVSLTVTAVADEPYLTPYYTTTVKNGGPITIDLTNYIYDVDGTPVVDEDSEDASIDGLVITYTPPTDFTGIASFNYTVRGVSAPIHVWVYETGQWATSIEAESAYGIGEAEWSASKAAGAPNVFEYGDSGSAWAAEEADDGAKYVTAQITATEATGVIVRESNAVGFVTSIAIHRVSDDSWHEMWTGSDPSTGKTLTDLILRFPNTGFTVDAVRVIVNTNHVQGDWEEIDAIRLLTGGSPSTTTINALPFNTRPVAIDDVATAELNQTITINVLANDYDANGDTLSITSKTDGENGVVDIVGTTVTYDPDSDWDGTDTFTYTISDGDKTTTATVHVTVYALGQWASTVSYSSQRVNNNGDSSGLKALGTPDTFSYGDAATAWTPQYANIGEQTITVGFAVPDEAKGVVIRETSGNGFVTKIELQDVGNTWHTVWTTLTGTDTSTKDGPVDFTQMFEEPTEYVVKAVRVTVDTDLYDGYEAIDSIRLLTAAEDSPANTAPTAENFEIDTSENVPQFIYAMADAADADDDPLHLSVAEQPEHGSVEVNNAGTPDDTSDDFLVYTPHADYHGEDSFTYRVTDVWGASDTATVDVTIASVNQGPYVANDTADVDINGSVIIPILANDSDAEEDTLTVSAVTQGQNGTVTITGGSTTVTYAPDTDFVGTDWFTYTVSDGTTTTVAQIQVTVHAAGQWASSVIAASHQIDKTNVLGAPDGSYWYAGSAQLEFITVGVSSVAPATGVLQYHFRRFHH